MRPTYIRKVPLLQQPLPPQPRPLVPLRADALGWAWGACPCQSPSPSLDPSSCPSTASALILSSKPRPCCRPVPKHLPTQSRNLRGPSAPRSMRLASASSPAGRGRGPPFPVPAQGAAHAAPSSTLRERGDTPVEQAKGVGREVLRAPPRAAAPRALAGGGASQGHGSGRCPPHPAPRHGERGALLNDPKIAWDFRTAPNWKGPEHPTTGADVAVTARSETQRPTVA